LADGEYARLLENLDAFYTAFQDQWETVNKTYGFELQDIRLGGLLARIKNCKRRLLDYANGKVDRIAELEEEVLPHDGGNVCQWHHAFSANTIAMNYIII